MTIYIKDLKRTALLNLVTSRDPITEKVGYIISRPMIRVAGHVIKCRHLPYLGRCSNVS